MLILAEMTSPVRVKKVFSNVMIGELEFDEAIEETVEAEWPIDNFDFSDVTQDEANAIIDDVSEAGDVVVEHMFV